MERNNRYYCADHPANSLTASHTNRAAGSTQEIEITPCPLCVADAPCKCPLCVAIRERDKYEAALLEITDEVEKRPGTPGYPTILAIIKRAMTPE